MADDTPSTGRTTAPQSAFGFEAVRTGIIVFLIGIIVAIGVPVLVFG